MSDTMTEDSLSMETADAQQELEETDEESMNRLLFALTAPPMEMWKAITPAALMSMSLYSIYRLMPFVLSALQDEASRSSKNRGKLVRTLRVFRSKISACRILKFRFLSLVQKNEEFKKFWNVKISYDPHCYSQSNVGFDAFAIDQNDFSPSNTLDLDTYNQEADDYDAKEVQQPGLVHSDGAEALTAEVMRKLLLEDQNMLVYVAITEILHPVRGVRLKERCFRMKKYKETFHANEAVDFLVSKLGLQNDKRDVAVACMQKIREAGLITRLGLRSSHFKDDKHLWVVNINRITKEHGTCIQLSSGEKVACYNQAQLLPETELINQIELAIGVDEIDLQNLKFWTDEIFNVKDVKKGDALAYRLIVHPLGDGSCEKARISRSNSSDESLLNSPSDSLRIDSVLSSESESPSDKYGKAIVFAAQVEKVFSSIARPFIMSLRNPETGSSMDDVSTWKTVGKNVLAKSGDNLMQDFLVQIAFRLFNAMWKHDADEFADGLIPFTTTYEVFPTGPKTGLMEVVKGVESLKDFDWTAWRSKYADDIAVQHRMIASAAGAYVGAYVLGVRDRHWDNILIADETTLMHIDFGFLLGQEPPIDAPRFSISPAMQAAFEQLGIWDDFLEVCGRAFLVLHRRAGRVLRAVEAIFPYAGFPKYVLRKHINGPFALNSHVSEKESVENVIAQIAGSASAWKTKLKSVFHNNIDPVFYSLLENRFPPAVLAMKIVDGKRDSKGKTVIRANSNSLNNTFSLH
jgi:hypothetical protein